MSTVRSGRMQVVLWMSSMAGALVLYVLGRGPVYDVMYHDVAAGPTTTSPVAWKGEVKTLLYRKSDKARVRELRNEDLYRSTTEPLIWNVKSMPAAARR